MRSSTCCKELSPFYGGNIFWRNDEPNLKQCIAHLLVFKKQFLLSEKEHVNLTYDFLKSYRKKYRVEGLYIFKSHTS